MSQVLQKYVLTWVVCSAVLLSGCDQVEVVENDAPANLSPPAANQAPTISGSPIVNALINNSWAFTPSSSDPDGDTLTFEIQNRPVWTSFNAQTGRLSGTPILGHEGNYSGIRITVSDGTMSATLPDFTLTVQNVSTNNAPQINGNAPAIVTIDQQYVFQPSASDPDGDDLSFAIANLPQWAAFDDTTGLLSGMPVQGDEAVFDSIVISVSDGELMASLPAFAITVIQAATGTVTLTWTPATNNTDGSTLTDLAAYKIYYGLSEGDYPNEILIDNPGISSYVVENLSPNGYYFVSTSINSSEVESDFSNVAFKTVTAN
jgi:hypothetical protein